MAYVYIDLFRMLLWGLCRISLQVSSRRFYIWQATYSSWSHWVYHEWVFKNHVGFFVRQVWLQNYLYDFADNLAGNCPCHLPFQRSCSLIYHLHSFIILVRRWPFLHFPSRSCRNLWNWKRRINFYSDVLLSSIFFSHWICFHTNGRQSFWTNHLWNRGYYDFDKYRFTHGIWWLKNDNQFWRRNWRVKREKYTFGSS